METGYQMNFNQDFTSISALSSTAFRLFFINSQDKIDEIFYTENTENIRLVERLFNSSLVVLVTAQKPNCLKMLHFKKKQDICNCIYPSEILCVRMNRQRLVVCLAESLHIHDIRNMKILHSIGNIAPNDLGLCSLSLNSHLAFPICSTSGELRIFDAHKLKQGLTIKAHDTKLSAINFAPSGNLLATASERGTVIRVFCVENGQRVQEFRRGVKRCVHIASLVFSTSGDFLCASSNTETVHIFKIDSKAVELAGCKMTGENVGKYLGNHITGTAKTSTDNAVAAEAKLKTSTSTSTTIDATNNINNNCKSNTNNNNNTIGGWSDYLTKAVSSYLIPTQVCDVLAQDRAFATAALAQPGLRHVCGLARIQREWKLLIACEDGFLYIHDFNAERGGTCKLHSVHDLRCALEGVVELNLSDSLDKMPMHSSTITTSKPTHTSTPLAAKSCAASVLIENPEPFVDNSYAGILKGDQTANQLTDSAKFRKLCDAIDTPIKLYDERQFPPVAIAAKD